MAIGVDNQAKNQGYLHGDFRYFHLKDSEGSELSFHYHEFAKVVMLRSGRADYIVEQVTYPLKPGSILLVPHHAIHRAVIDQSVPYDRIILYLNRRYFEKTMASAGLPDCFARADIHGNCLLVPDEKSRKEIDAALAEYEESAKDSQPGAEAIRRAVMTKLLIRISRVSGPAGKPAGHAYHSRQYGSRMAETMTYISENLQADLTVDALAARLCLSRYHFMRLFRDSTGTTVHAYVRQERLLGAARMIRGGASAAQAAAECGFADYSSFSRAFMEAFGIRPSDLK